jgi:hypothetical protein
MLHRSGKTFSLGLECERCGVFGERYLANPGARRVPVAIRLQTRLEGSCIFMALRKNIHTASDYPMLIGQSPTGSTSGAQHCAYVA